MTDIRCTKTLAGGKDCLNTIRLLAAIQVLYGHATAHLNIPYMPILGDFINFFKGVPIFFTMSGFLIWWSIGRSQSYSQYLRKRFWRIYPELWVAVLVEVIVLLLLYHEYINWGQFGLFIFTQCTFFQFWTPDCLRAYGCGCPNGALWTIVVLIQYYIVAYFIYKLLHGRNMRMWILSIIASVGLSCITPLIDVRVPVTIAKLYHQTLFPYLWMFLIPSIVAERKDDFLPMMKKHWWVFGIIALVVMYSGYDLKASYGFLQTTALFFGLTGFAYVAPCLNVKTDISYGVYIYHMTFVNAFIALGFTGKPLYLFIIAIMTFVMSYVSTKTIGTFSQSKKRKA